MEFFIAQYEDSSFLFFSYFSHDYTSNDELHLCCKLKSLRGVLLYQSSAGLDTPCGTPDQKWSTRQFHQYLFMVKENAKAIIFKLMSGLHL